MILLLAQTLTPSVDVSTPLAVFLPTVVVLVAIGSLGVWGLTLLVRGQSAFDRQLRAWMTGDEGRAVLMSVFWGVTKSEDYSKWLKEKVDHKVDNGLTATNVELKQVLAALRGINDTLDKRFEALQVELREDRKLVRQLEREFYRAMGKHIAAHEDPPTV
jgi:hypothetical protein